MFNQIVFYMFLVTVYDCLKPLFVTFWYGSADPYPYQRIKKRIRILLFSCDFQDAKKSWFSSTFLLITYRRYIYISLQRKHELESKIVESWVFLHVFACWWRNPDPDTYTNNCGSGSSGLKTYGSEALLETILKTDLFVHTFGICLPTI